MENYNFDHLFHIVAASGDALVIGTNNHLPWVKISEDLRHFKATTAGSTVIMGRNTFESINAKPLPNRVNMVVSHSHPDGQAEKNLFFYNSLEDALHNAATPTVFIIGGGNVFQQTIDKADGIIMTKIPGSYTGDTFYPPIPTYFEEIPEMKRYLRESDIPTAESPEVVYYKNLRKVAPDSNPFAVLPSYTQNSNS